MERPIETPDFQSIDADPNSGSGLSILGVLWRQKWIILLLTVVGAGLGYLSFIRRTPVYQSTATMLIVKKDTKLPGQEADGRSAYDNTISLHNLLLRSPKIVAKALEKQTLKNRSSLRDEADPAGTIISGLGVDCKAAGAASVLMLTYTGSDPQDCATILKAIVAAYQEFLGETYQTFSEETVQLIGQAKDVLLKQLSEREEVYRQFRQEAPLLWKGATGGNLHEARLAEIETRRSGLIVEAAQTKSRIEGIQAAMKKGGNREALLLLVNQGAAIHAKSGRTADDPVFSQLLEEQIALEEYGKDHPKVKALKKRTELIRNHSLSAPLDKAELGKSADFLETYLESLRQDLRLQEEALEGLDTLFEEERQSAKKLSIFQVKDEAFRTEIARIQQLFSAVVKRLDEISLVKDYGGVKTQLIAPPEVGWQIAPQFFGIMSTACMLGALAGFGLGWLIEFMDRRFASPDEIRRSLGLSIMGHIPMISDAGGRKPGVKGAAKAAVADETLCVVRNPKGRQAEAYRAIRTALYFSTHSQGHKVIQITSASPGDGKTTTSTNLAFCIADSGKRTLLIDADFRRPRVHEYLGLGNEVGLSTAITGETEIFDVIQPTSIENLWVITSGGRPANPAELLTSSRFKELLDVVKEQYDFVIIDTPPVLAVTDPLVVAPRVDGVILVMRLTKNARSDVRMAMENLTSLGASVLGLVINAVATDASTRYGGYKYGYGGYGYSYRKGYHSRYYTYGYGYNYGYGYGYGDRAHSYYEDESPSKDDTAASNGHGNGNGNGNGAISPKNAVPGAAAPPEKTV